MTNQILTEEGVRHIEKIAANGELSYAISSMLITSHRAINERNRMLVQENDELSYNDIRAKAKVKEYYLGLKSVNGVNQIGADHAMLAIENVLDAFKIKILEVNDYE